MERSSNSAVNAGYPFELYPLLLRTVTILRSYLQQCGLDESGYVQSEHATRHPDTRGV